MTTTMARPTVNDGWPKPEHDFPEMFTTPRRTHPVSCGALAHTEKGRRKGAVLTGVQGGAMRWSTAKASGVPGGFLHDKVYVKSAPLHKMEDGTKLA
jgi:hypothetical protein